MTAVDRYRTLGVLRVTSVTPYPDGCGQTNNWQIQGVVDVKASLGDRRPEFRIDVNRDLANDVGLDIGLIAATVRPFLAGQTATRWEDPTGEEREVVVRFDERAVKYDYADLDELVLGYACSIHKAQGSEFPAVVIPLHTQHYVMLQRNLLYTAVTRGRRLVVVAGSRRALAIAVKTERLLVRHTRLIERIRDRLPTRRDTP